MATKNIKGITIEIGGNTTKLQDALKSVDKTIYNLNGDLKNLNQALKLDPKNTELLAQKQDVLRRNIQGTEERLRTLIEAQRQMGSYVSLTDEQKESYNALSLEIAKSKSALQGMNNELKTTKGMDLSKLQTGLKKVGEVALDVSKKILKVSSAISGALAGLITAGVKSYSNLEQSIGGIETLFGDSASKVLENAQKAYETAGVSANEYMQGVTSFSASLLQSLGGNTEKAADIADMAFRDMSDNANKFGTSMESIQNAYQGFAKQNYTMLDNLKLGYGGTKKEMERLLADAEKLTGTKYDIENLSDVYNAIHIIQTELGVTGTTSKEAATTISGSAKQMKSAFDNFLNGSGSAGSLSKSVSTFLSNVMKAVRELAPDILEGISALLEELAPQIAQMLIETIPQLFQSIGNMLDELMTLVANNTDRISETIADLINKAAEFIARNLPTIVQMGVTLIVALVNGITNALPTLAEAIPDIVTTIVNVLIENIPAILNAAIELLNALIEAIPVIVERLVENLPQIITTIMNTLVNNTPQIVKAAFKMLMGLVEAIPQIIIELGKSIPTIITSIVKYLWDNKGKIFDAGVDLLIQLKDGVFSKVHEVIDWVGKLPGVLADEIKKFAFKIYDAGKNLILGFWDGITDKWDSMKEKVSNFWGGVVDTAKSIFGIHSPSRVFRDEIGQYLALGLAQGFEETMGDVTEDMIGAVPLGELQNEVTRAMSGLSYGIEHSVNPQINPNITFNQNYEMMAQAMKTALKDTSVELDGRELGQFVDKTISEEVFN